jgi:hypothetical protein
MKIKIAAILKFKQPPNRKMWTELEKEHSTLAAATFAQAAVRARGL